MSRPLSTRRNHPVHPVNPVQTDPVELLDFSVPPCLRGEILPLPTLLMHPPTIPRTRSSLVLLRESRVYYTSFDERSALGCGDRSGTSCSDLVPQAAQFRFRVALFQGEADMVCRWILSVCLVGSLLVTAAVAAITPEQKKEIIELNRSMGVLAAQIKKKEYPQVEELLKTVETRVAEIAKEAGVEPTDKAFAAVNKTLANHHKNLDKAQGKAPPPRERNQGVSFTKDVAPLINEKCVNCHGAAMQSGNLRLDTFANWIKGGKSGPLLTVGNPQQSRILNRMATPDMNLRMPKNAAAIERDKLNTIATWVSQGAMFDGDNQDTPLSKLRTKLEAEAEEATIKIVKPKGTETVSFTKDVAPFMANLCLGCHSGNNLRGGLSLETFYDMMKGGDSGHVVLPGEPRDKSRLFRLTGGLELPRMPNNNQVRITARNYEDLKTWFDEGCVYDGVDPKTPLRSFIKTEAEMALERASQLSPAAFNQMRKEKTAQQMKQAAPNDTPTTLESEDLLIVGNAPEARIQQVETWAKQHVLSLRNEYNARAGQLWKGRLAVIVMKDRFGYEEFSQTVNGRPAAEGVQGHLVISATLDDAYIVLEDVGDEVSAKSPGLRVNLIDQLTGAYLKRSGANLPNWLTRGLGLSLAMKVVGRNAYIDAMPKEAATLIPTLANPQDVFVDASFSPAAVGAVGVTLVEYLMVNGGQTKFGELVRALQGGMEMGEAITESYGIDSATLGGRFRDALKGK